MASVCTIPSTGFKGEVQQVIQADFFRSSKLSRAKLGPACLCYLESRNVFFLRCRMDAALCIFLFRIWYYLLASSSTCNAILSPTSLRGSLVKILAFLWIGAARARKSVTFGEGGLTLAAIALGASIIFAFCNKTKLVFKYLKSQLHWCAPVSDCRCKFILS